MRASLSCQIHVRRFDVWRRAIAVVAVAAVSALIAWMAERDATESRGLDAAFASISLVALMVALRARRVEAGRLRLDEGVWTFAPDGAPEGATSAGDVEVAIDAGSFLLLRFIAAGDADVKRRARWLPVQRRGLEGEWHALRCAVYSPRLAAVEPASGSTRSLSE